jgi:hypothetical protein
VIKKDKNKKNVKKNDIEIKVRVRLYHLEVFYIKYIIYIYIK